VRTPITRLEKSVGAFLSVVTALVVVALLASGRRTDLFDMFREGFIFYAVSETAHGCAVGSPVKVRDVEVGSVTEVKLAEDPQHPGMPVRITFRIQPSAARFLHDRTIALIIEPPLGSGMPPFGTSSVELRTEGDAPLARRAVIQVEGQESMVRAMGRMSRDVSAMREQMMSTIGEMGTTFANIRKLTDALANGKGMAGRMLSDQQLANDLEGMVKEGRSVTSEAKRLMTDMGKVTAKAPGMVDDARAMSDKAQKLMTKVDRALDALPELLAATERTLALTEELIGTLRVAAGHAPDLARKVDVSLDETNRLVEAAQRNFILRSTLPDRKTLRTESEVRPPVLLPDAGP
jgi:ABC-type transporter Mla subunit MlaD